MFITEEDENINDLFVNFEKIVYDVLKRKNFDVSKCTIGPLLMNINAKREMDNVVLDGHYIINLNNEKIDNTTLFTLTLSLNIPNSLSE